MVDILYGFSELANRVAMLSQSMAGRQNHTMINSGHIVLALVTVAKNQSSGIGRFFQQMEIDLPSIDRAVENFLKRGTAPLEGPPQYGQSAERVFNSARDEATNQGTDRVEPMHILCALLKEKDGVAAEAFKQLAIDPAHTWQAAHHYMLIHRPVTTEATEATRWGGFPPILEMIPYPHGWKVTEDTIEVLGKEIHIRTAYTDKGELYGISLKGMTDDLPGLANVAKGLNEALKAGMPAHVMEELLQSVRTHLEWGSRLSKKD